jgi:hypothetical protein
MHKIEIRFFLIAFMCLLVIVIRAKPPLWGGMRSKEMQKDLDNKDKLLAIIAAVFFIIAMAMLFARI